MTDDRKVIDIKTRASLSVEQATKSRAYVEGCEAHRLGMSLWDNPYERMEHPDAYREWARGYRQAEWERQ